MRRLIWWALVWIMTCCLFGAKPLSKPMLHFWTLRNKQIQRNLNINTRMSTGRWVNDYFKSVNFFDTLQSLYSRLLWILDLCVTRQIWGIWKLRPAYRPETPNLGKNLWCFVPCDLEIWWMTMENNRASLLCCFKLCATFHSHWWIQTEVTVRKRPIWVKFDDF